MTDRKKSADELGAKVAFQAAKNAAGRALENALSTDEERAQRTAAQAEVARRRRNKRIALGVVGLLLVLGAIGLALHFWYWFLLLGLIGLAGLYGRHRWRRGRAARKKATQLAAQAPAKQTRAEPPSLAAQVVTPEHADASIEDELAELKARVGK